MVRYKSPVRSAGRIRAQTRMCRVSQTSTLDDSKEETEQKENHSKEVIQVLNPLRFHVCSVHHISQMCRLKQA